jgi:hypothetical protein
VSADFIWCFGGYKLASGEIVKVQRNQNFGHVYALVRDKASDYTYKRYGRNHKSFGWKLDKTRNLLAIVRAEIEAGTAQWRDPSTLQWTTPKERTIK